MFLLEICIRPIDLITFQHSLSFPPFREIAPGYICLHQGYLRRAKVTRLYWADVFYTIQRKWGSSVKVHVLYSGKLLREKTFVNFAVLCLSVKVFSAII